MRPMFGLSSVSFTPSHSQKAVLFLVDLAAGDDVGNRRESHPERRERRFRSQHTATDRPPTIKASSRFEYPVGEVGGAHPPRLEDRVSMAIVPIQPPPRREQPPLGRQPVIERGARAA